jgi:hypothetical protein
MGFVGDTVDSIRSLHIRQVLTQIISLGETRLAASAISHRFFFLDLSSRGKASRVGEWASRMACSMWVHSIVHYLCLKEGLVTEERRFVDFKCLA